MLPVLCCARSVRAQLRAAAGMISSLNPWSKHILGSFLIIYFTVICLHNQDNSRVRLPSYTNDHTLGRKEKKQVGVRTTADCEDVPGLQVIWAAMGLCWSEAADHHGKAGYPYKDVTPLALLLWRYHLPAVRTIVRIVYTEREVNIMMEAYGEMLQRAGAVVEWIKADGMDCVLKSQLVRCFKVSVELNVKSVIFPHKTE